MYFQIENREQGYVVSAYFDRHWHALRNFGDKQSDAIEFCNYDCPKMAEINVRYLAKHFDVNTKYVRVDGRNFKKQNGDGFW